MVHRAPLLCTSCRNVAAFVEVRWDGRSRPVHPHGGVIRAGLLSSSPRETRDPGIYCERCRGRASVSPEVVIPRER